MAKFFVLILIGSMSLFGFDVVIPVHRKDKENLEIIINILHDRVPNLGKIYYISKEKLTEQAIWISEADFPFSIDDIGKEIGNNGGIGKFWRNGWYLQQLYKFYAFQVIEELSHNFLILDCDSVPNHSIKFISDDGRVYLDYLNKPQALKQMVDHLQNLLPNLEELNLKRDPVVHHMVFSKDILIDLFEAVETKHSKPFWKAFLHLVKYSDYPESPTFCSGASEYMIYFHYCMNFHPDKIVIREVKLYDIANSLLDKFPNSIDFIASHSYNTQSWLFDVIMFVPENKIEQLDATIEYLRKTIYNIQNIYLISKERYTNNAEWIDLKKYPFSIDSVREESTKNTEVMDLNCLQQHYKTLLKLYAPSVIDELSRYFLFWDIGTIQVDHISWLINERKMYQDVVNKSRNSMINSTLLKLLPNLVDLDKIFEPVTGYMLISQGILKDLFLKVEKNHNKPFWITYCNIIPRDYFNRSFNQMSEYMIYYQFCQNFYKDYIIKRNPR